jgi:diguanylate cyclase (GGDEF)-like protein
MSASAQERSLKWTRSAKWLSALSFLAVLGLCAASGFMLWQMRLDAEQRAEITSRSLLQVLERDIARNIKLYDLSMQSVVEGMLRPEVVEASPQLRQMILFERAATVEGFVQSIILNKTGDVIANSQTLGPVSGNFSERNYFRHFVETGDNGLYIGSPIVSRLTGQWMLPLSRRLRNTDGSFAGVVAGGIDLAYFHNLFTAAKANQVGTVTLYGRGGSIVMRSPFDEHQIGSKVDDTSSYREILKVREGDFVGAAMVGSGDRRFIFTHIENYPLQLSTAVPPAQIYADWNWKALGLGGIVLCLSAVTMLLTWQFGRELTRRHHAEEAATALNAELATLATTDALTGLANRRRFDEVLTLEWRRSVRTQQPLSLIILDADCFKGFNDRYGHQKGDEALKLIARSIEAATDPNQDVACRIGGEEFAVILPGTNAIAAEVVADRIRDAVSGWRLPHAANPHAVVTISCGLAQIPLTPAIEPAALIAAADAALYEAKRLGRNRVRVAGRSPSHLRLA